MIIHEVEQRSDDWYALRLGTPTASNFGKLVTSKGELSNRLNDYAVTLAGERLAGVALDAWQGNPYMERGTQLEEEAVAFYEFEGEIDVQQVGFVTDNDGLYGCSPDGLVELDGMLEIKCLKAENHIKAILYHRKHGCCPPKYVQQTQGQMMICEREWCDLLFYHPDLPNLVIRQYPDPGLAEALQSALIQVCAERDRIYEELKDYAQS